MFFFFQAEDGIRDYKVTGVQTCALPISSFGGCDVDLEALIPEKTRNELETLGHEIGRASCRKSVDLGGRRIIKKKKKKKNKKQKKNKKIKNKKKKKKNKKK